MLLRTVLEKTHKERPQKFQGEAIIAVRGNYFVSSKDVNSRRKVETGEWRLGRYFVEVYYGTVLETLAPLYTYSKTVLQHNKTKHTTDPSANSE